MGERFRLGRVVGRSFAIWARELPLLLALALVVHAPRVACTEALEDALLDSVLRYGTGQWFAWPILFRIALLLLSTLFTNLSQAVVVFAVYARIRGRRARFGESLRGGLGRLLPVLRVALLLFAIQLLVGAAFGLLFLFLGRQWLLRGSIGLVIEASTAIVLSPFWVAVPAAVFDTPRALLRRSAQLTRGHRLAILAILLLVSGIDWGAGELIVRALPSDLPPSGWRTLGWIHDLVLASLVAVFAAVGYHALRLEKEGVDVSELEEVFA